MIKKLIVILSEVMNDILINKLIMNYIKGFEYEKFTRDYLLQNHKIVYLWKHVPLEELVNLGFI
jgi:hypothetical protein